MSRDDRADLRAQHLVRADEAVARSLSSANDQLVFIEVEAWNPHGPADAPAPQPGVRGAIRASVAEHFGTREQRAPGEGGRPLPSARELADTVRGWGLERDTPVVVYTQSPDDYRSAARAWFTLRWGGLTDVRVLDGQLPAWVAAGGAVSLDPTPPRQPSAFEVTPGVLRTLDADAAASAGRSGILLDARPAKAYTGSDDPRSGHIPGALSAPSSELTPGGFLLPEADLRAWFAARGLADAIPTAERGAYCGGGVAAAALVFAAATLGLELPLYVASWSGWSAEGRPAERGALQTA